MAFLDNSGDIILDAVLTDAGRKRLAAGDGSFRVVSYAFGDDEINYALYDKNHVSGSAYYDLEIMKTPIFEAFTNNMSSMKSKLLSISRTNLLYLPIIKVNTGTSNSTTQFFAGGKDATNPSGKDLFVVAVDQETSDVFLGNFGTNAAGGQAGQDYVLENIETSAKGVLSGIGLSQFGSIRLDQGLDTDEISPSFGLDADLKETQYIIEIDNRLGYISSTNSSLPSGPNYIDDDEIASYLISTADANFVRDNLDTSQVTTNGAQTLRGPRGTILEFSIQSSIELQSGTFLFERMGQTIGDIAPQGANFISGMGFKHHFIDTNVRVTGVTTGYSIDIPVRFVKYDTDIA